MTSPRTRSDTIRVLALLGSVLMFGGWVIVILSAFHHIGNLALVIGVAVVAFGVVLIPAGMDLVAAREVKRNARSIVISAVPAVGLFLVALVTLHTNGPAAVVASLCEIAGMAAYLWAWWAA